MTPENRDADVLLIRDGSRRNLVTGGETVPQQSGTRRRQPARRGRETTMRQIRRLFAICVNSDLGCEFTEQTYQARGEGNALLRRPWRPSNKQVNAARRGRQIPQEPKMLLNHSFGRRQNLRKIWFRVFCRDWKNEHCPPAVVLAQGD
jgi:hypothetical protein